MSALLICPHFLFLCSVNGQEQTCRYCICRPPPSQSHSSAKIRGVTAAQSLQFNRGGGAPCLPESGDNLCHGVQHRPEKLIVGVTKGRPKPQKIPCRFSRMGLKLSPPHHSRIKAISLVLSHGVGWARSTHTYRINFNSLLVVLCLVNTTYVLTVYMEPNCLARSI